MEGIVSFGDWQKINLRVAKILKVEEIEGADKLYKLEVDLGKEIGKRVICAGIKKYYKKDELIDKSIIVISNLEPKKMKGIESKGMLLAAGSKEEDFCVLISPEKNVKPGTKIS
jgi:methionyl-tRNA synthetase